ncbi:MAG TPA: tyrosine-type recombinase/integrase, partial [Nitrososphaera sp.]|nr:tyrosine-type recombinase/integrase [Nitrososphaera sp.]
RKPRTKAGRPHLLPLPKPLITMFMHLPRFDGNEHVFPSCRKKGGHLVGLQKAWERIRDRAEKKYKGVQEIRLHDLRRTTGSWMVMSGRSLPMIGQILDHSQQRTTQIYAQFALDPVREALDQNAQQMVKIGKLKVLTRRNK